MGTITIDRKIVTGLYVRSLIELYQNIDWMQFLEVEGVMIFFNANEYGKIKATYYIKNEIISINHSGSYLETMSTREIAEDFQQDVIDALKKYL